MPSATSPPNKRRRIDMPADIDASNETTRLFMGSPQHSWMAHPPPDFQALNPTPLTVPRRHRVISSSNGRQAMRTIPAPTPLPTPANDAVSRRSSDNNTRSPNLRGGGEFMTGHNHSGSHTHHNGSVGFGLQTAESRSGSSKETTTGARSDQTGSSGVVTLPSPAPSDDQETMNTASAQDGQPWYRFSSELAASAGLPVQALAQGLPIGCGIPDGQRSSAVQEPNVSRTNSSRAFPFIEQPHDQAAPHNVSNIFSREACLPRVIEFVDRRFPSPRWTRADTSRLNLLREAVEAGDTGFMVLNLLSVCSHTGPVSQDLAQALNSFTRENFLMLDRILSPAAALSAPVIEFFNNFPMSLKHLRQKLGLGPLKDLFATASFTLNCLQNRLAAMRDYFTAEKTLPLFQDMFDILGVSSPILQKVLFFYILTAAWGVQSINPFAKEAWSMFNTHKRNYFDHGSLGTEAANEARNQYKQLYQRHVPLQQQPHRHRQQSRQAAGVHQNEVAPFGAIPLNHGQLGGQIALHGYNPPYGPMQTLPRVLPNMHGTPTNAGIPMQPQCFGHTPFGNMTSNNVQVHTLPFNQAQLPASTSYNIGVQAPPQQANSGAARPAPQTNASSQFGTSGQILRVQALNAVGNMTTRPNPGLPHLNNLAIGRPLPLQKPTPFVPPEGFRPMIPARPDPGRAALHQAHLRSPILRARTLMSGQSSLERLYRYVDGFALLPKQLSEKLSVQEFRFIVDAAELDPPPKLQVPDNGTAGTKSVDSCSRQFRLKCCKLRLSTPDELTDDLWATLESVWEHFLFFKLNGTVLEARRKLQHGRELPIDITNVLRPGENVLTVLVNRTSADKTPFRYAVAVETVLFASGDAIKQDRTAHATVSDVDVLANIKSSLSRSGARDGDDEIMVLQTNITIPLFEPFSNARIFDLPVRGESCAHRQAFDLAMFLETRPTVSKGAFSQVDVWKCPFCNGDVRPNKLVVDGFLVRVRADLEAKRMLDTRAIVVESDGSWKPRIDPIDARAEDEDETTEQRKDDEGAASATPKKSVDVIEIDSD